MFEVLTVNIADQWDNISLGHIVEAALFFEKVELITPGIRLTEIVRSRPDAIVILNDLIKNDHLSIEINQFPAGELALEIGLIMTGVTALFMDSEYWGDDALGKKDLWQTMRREYEGFRSRALDSLINDIYRENILESAWQKHAESLAESLMVPKPTPELFASSIDDLQTLFSSDGIPLLESILLNSENYEKGFQLRPFEYLGREFKQIVSSDYASGGYLEDVSFAGFVATEVKRDSLRDTYTTPRFNRTMNEAYKRIIDRSTAQYEVDVFQEVALKSAPIREAFDAGEIEWAKVLQTLEKKGAFVSEIKGMPLDRSLAEWWLSTRTEGVLSRNIGQKSLRFGGFAAAGLALDALIMSPGLGTAAGLGLGALDSIFLDNLIRKKGPSSYIEDGLKGLVT